MIRFGGEAMSNPRYHNIISAAEYAKLHGISARTARRQLAESSNAVKTGRGYKVAIPSTTYARLKGITPTEARRSGTKSADPIRDVIADIPGTSRLKLAQTLAAAAPNASARHEYNASAMRINIGKMSPRQRALAAQIRNEQDYIDAMGDDDFLDDEGNNLLWYH